MEVPTHCCVPGSRFSYDAPVETSIRPANSPLTGNMTLTLFGSNFGASNSEMQIILGETSCTSAVWVSDSQVLLTQMGLFLPSMCALSPIHS